MSLLSLIYPPLCFHCSALLENPRHYFCLDCLQFFQPDAFEDRCPYCFTELDPNKLICNDCARKPSIFHGMSSVFEAHGPPLTLLKRSKEEDLPFLAKSIGAYLTWKLATLPWQSPEVIVPVPESTFCTFKRGYDFSLLIAEAISQFIHVPICKALSKKRLNSSIVLKNEFLDVSQSEKIKLQGKRVLLVDDLQVTGATLKESGECLLAAIPSKIYALTFCYGIR